MKFRDRQLPETPTAPPALPAPPTTPTPPCQAPACLAVEGRPWYRGVDRRQAEQLVTLGGWERGDQLLT